MSLWQKLTQRLMKPTSRAIGFHEATGDFSERKLKMAPLAAYEMLVDVQASAINPVDVKMKSAYQQNDFRVLGFDAVGTVVAVGNRVTNFQVGDTVYYAGQQFAPGSLQTRQKVDARLVGHAPSTLTPAQSAALPLTSLTAYELLTEAFQLPFEPQSAQGKTLLIINGAGGVGSMLIQLAKYLGMTVIATASRPNSVTWVEHMGADFVLNHHQDLTGQLTHIQHDQVDFIAILADTDAYWQTALDVIKPFGRIGSIVETQQALDMGPLKNIGAQFAWVFMFAKGNFQHDMAQQGQALDQIAQLVDQGHVQSTLRQTYHGLTVANVTKAFEAVKSHQAIGKVVITHE